MRAASSAAARRSLTTTNVFHSSKPTFAPGTTTKSWSIIEADKISVPKWPFVPLTVFASYSIYARVNRDVFYPENETLVVTKPVLRIHEY